MLVPKIYSDWIQRAADHRVVVPKSARVFVGVVAAVVGLLVGVLYGWKIGALEAQIVFVGGTMSSVLTALEIRTGKMKEEIDELKR